SGGNSEMQQDASVEKKSIFKAVTSRFRGGERAQTPTDPAVYDDGVSDTPLEPDTAQAEVAEIIARVRREREGGKAPAVSSVAGGETPAPAKTDSTSSKSDFIAAARRAAQAAASDAQAAETRTVSKSDGLKSTVSGLMSGKRRPILIGAAAILVAMLALPFVRGLLGGAEEVAAVPTPVPAIEQTVEAEAALEAIEPAVEPEIEQLPDAPRIVEIESNAAAPISAAPLDTADETVLQLDAQEQPAAPQATIDPTPVAAIPADAGTSAMQDAARSGDVTAMFLVGDYFAAKAQNDGPTSAAQNNADALGWYTKSAEAGYAPAQQRLGSIYEKGIGADKDLSLAKSWYQLAAEQGNAAAMHNLGVLYANGVDVSPNLTEAVRWFEQAALYGVPDSQYNLGVMAVRGDGMEASLKDSYKWFALAANNGDSDAASKRDTVAERMDPATLKTAQDEVALWRARQTDQTANIVSVPDAWQTDQMRTAAAPPPSEPIDMQKAVRNIQAILNNNGYDAGPVDGVMGEKTRQAIRAFQAEKGMEPTGDVNEELVRKLLELTA
ncbi:MAG: peptidoglycan-binding protein, partial [Pseudomonadota bacterium]